MKIVFLDAATMGEVSFTPISVYGNLVCYDNSTPEEAISRVSDCDILLVNKVKVTSELIDAAPSLKLICETATGINNIDVDYAVKKGIIVKNVVGYSTDSVVQTTFMHILSLVGNAAYYDECVKSGRYSAGKMFTDPSMPYMELAGKTMGIIGLGAIGHKVAVVAEAFGMKVCYYSTSGTSHCKDFPSLSLEDLLTRADVVSVHAPLNERTLGLVGLKEMKMMKKSAIIVNMGRGGIVNEDDLAAAVDEGIIAGAALDVFYQEPLEMSNPLLNIANMDRMRFSPHVAWASVEARDRLIALTAENIAAFMNVASK